MQMRVLRAKIEKRIAMQQHLESEDDKMKRVF